MNTVPPNLSIREDLAISRWQATLQDNGLHPTLDLPSIEDVWPRHYSLPFDSPTNGLPAVCRCGAWQRIERGGSSVQCARTEARMNRHGEPIGGERAICSGQPAQDPRRVLLTAEVCGVENIVVGLVYASVSICGCYLCDWAPDRDDCDADETADVHRLMEHLVEQHGINGGVFRDEAVP